MPTQKRTAARMIEPQDFLLPDPTSRRRPAASPVRTSLIEDAVFEVVAPAPRPYRRVNDNPPRPSAGNEPQLWPMLVRIAGRLAVATEKQLAKLSPQAFMVLMTSFFLVVFWICGGFSALNIAGANRTDAPFTLVNTAVDTQDANGMKVAMVTGSIRNTSGRIIDAPQLAVVAGARQDIIGTVMLSVDRIGPGVTIPFASRFRFAGGKSSDIVIIPVRR